MKTTLIIVLFVVFGGIARADVIASAQPERKLYAILTESEFVPDDSVCIYVEDVKVACGDVFRTAGKGIIIYITKGDHRIFREQLKVSVKRQYTNPRSRIASLGADYLFPYVHAQQLIGPHVAYGFIGEGLIFGRNDTKMKGIAALMSLSYYGGSLLNGPWLMASAGLHIINVQPQAAIGEAERDGITSLLAQINIGWRFSLSDLSIGIAFGGKYFMAPQLRNMTYYNGFLPSAIIDVGYMF